MLLPDDLFDMERLKREVNKWREKGEKIVFTNGVFDILHVGHVDYLTRARSLGDRLIVGINSDASVRRLNKGPERPIQSDIARASVISALKPVDTVIIFDQDTPYELIDFIRPNVLVKGGDYNPQMTDPTSKVYIVGSNIVKNDGGEVVAIPFVQGFSTTSIVEKLKRAGQ